MRNAKKKTVGLLLCLAVCLGVAVFLITPNSQVTLATNTEDERQTYYGCCVVEEETGKEDVEESGLEFLNMSDCNAHSDVCGQGREKGNSDTFLSAGCRNWANLSYRYNGVQEIPYWINRKSFSALSDEYLEQIIYDIGRQAELWNKVAMHDGTGQLVHLFEIGENSETYPEYFNGKKVVEILRMSDYYSTKYDTAVGLFTEKDSKIHLRCYESGNTAYPDWNIDTPVHELGHLLGLKDLDADKKIEDGTHKVLMGYDRDTIESTLNYAIQYQDIQGVAAINKRHTNHDYRRYVQKNLAYIHICYYCDIENPQWLVLPDSEPLQYAEGCEHDYKPIVSAGNRYWIKCTKCYKVVESEYYIKEGKLEGRDVVEILGQIDENKTEAIIPNYIDGKPVRIIGEKAIANREKLVKIEIPGSVCIIKARAFENCRSLAKIELPFYLQEIGIGAFKGCNELEIAISAYNENYTVERNIIYNKGKSKIYGTGKIEKEIVIAATVEEIVEYAFAENYNLQSVSIQGKTNIKEYAFADCVNLHNVYFNMYEVPSIASGAFKNNEFNLYVPYAAQADYAAAITDAKTVTVTSVPLTVEYVSNGVTEKTENVYNGMKADLPEITKAGYMFTGWFKDEDCTQPFNSEYWQAYEPKVIRLYAGLEPFEYTVTLNLCGGEIVSGSTSFTAYYGEEFSLPCEAVKEGYTLDGWYDETEGGEKYATENGYGCKKWDKTENAILYARWRVKSYKIKITETANGQAVWLSKEGLTLEESSVNYGDSINVINLIYTFKNSVQGYEEGHIFERFDCKGEEIKWDSIPDLGEDGAEIIITPVWVKERYTVEFYKADGMGTEKAELAYGDKVTYPEAERTGYTFNGWYTKPVNGERIDWVTMPDITGGEQSNGSVTVYANWIANVYTVTFNPNGGMGVMPSVTYTYDKINTLPQNVYTKTGYNFKGWATSASGTEVVYTDRSTVINLAESGIVILTAVWEAKTYNIIYMNLCKNMSVYPITYRYGEGLNTMPEIYVQGINGPVRLDYFYGWYTSMAYTTKVESISKTSMEDIVLWAKYDIFMGTIYAPGRQTVTDEKNVRQPYFSIWINMKGWYEQIQDTNINKIQITFSLDLWKIDDGYQLFNLYYNGKSVWNKKIDHSGGSKRKRYTFEITLNAEEYKDATMFELRMGADGAFDDDWQFENFELETRLVYIKQ